MSAPVDVTPIIERQRAGRFWISMFVVSWLITFLDGFDFQLISFAGPHLEKAFGLSDSQLGTLGTVGLVGTLIGGLGLGYVGDRIGRKPTISICVVGFGVFMLLFAISGDYTQLIVWRTLSGVFLGAALPLTWALNTEYAPARMRSTSVVIIMIGYSLGAAVGGPLSNLLIPSYGWGSVFVAGGICSLLVVIPVLLVLPESVKFLAQKGRRPDKVAAVLGRVQPGLTFPEGTSFVVGPIGVDTKPFNPAMLFRGPLKRITPLLWVAYMCSSALIYYLAFWGPILNERMGFSVSAAANIAACAAVAGCVGQLIIGRFIDRRGAGTTGVMPLLAVPTLLVIGLITLQPALYIAVLMFAHIVIVGGHGGMHSIASIFYRPAIRSNGGAWATSIAKFGAMVGPLLAGVLLDAGLKAQQTFYVFAIFPVLMAILLFLVGAAQRRLPPEADGALAPKAAPAEPAPEAAV